MRFIAGPTLETTADGALVIRREGLTYLACFELGFLVVALPAVLAYLLVGPWMMGWAFQGLVLGTVFQTSLGLLLLLMFAYGAWDSYPHLACGVWRLDAAGATFRSEGGLDHQVAWAEVERVWWTRRWIRLVGPRDQVLLEVHNTVKPAWQVLPARVEAALSPRFDLTFRETPRGEFRLARVAPVLVLIGLAAWGFVRLTPFLTDHQFGELVLGLLMVSFYGKLALFCWLGTVRANRLNPFWRLPRSSGQVASAPQPGAHDATDAPAASCR